jgi:hypothetical protein
MWLWLPVIIILGACGGKGEAKKAQPAPETKAAVAAPAVPEAAPAPAEDPAAAADKAKAQEVEAAAAAATAKADDREAARLAEEAKAPAPAAPADGRVELASFGDQRFYLDELQAYVDTLPPYQKNDYSSFTDRRELLKTWILQEMVAKKALEAGFDKDPRVVAAYKNNLVKVFLSDTFSEEALPEVSLADITARYEAEQARFNLPEKVRAAHIMVKDRKVAEGLLAEAKKALEKPGSKPKREFGELARKHSLDAESARRGGDLLYFAADGKLGSGEALDPAVAAAAFGIKEINGLSGVVRSAKGYHLVMLLGRRAAETSSLEQAREELRITLAREKLQKDRQAYLDGLLKFEDWTVSTKALGDLKIGEVTDAPGAVKARADNAQTAPNKPDTEEETEQQ